MRPSLLDAILAELAADADLVLVEAAMGLFDGLPGPGGRRGAAADLAARYRLPVILVIDATGQTQSAAAVVRGFAAHDPAVNVAGVILNRVATDRHRAYVADAIAATGIPVLGAARPRRRRSRCPRGISAWCRPASMATSTPGSTASPTRSSARRRSRRAPVAGR